MTEIRIPKIPTMRWSFQKFNRRAQDWAIVAALAIRADDTRVALVNMGQVPLRASGVEEAIRGGSSSREAAIHASDGTSPPSDTSGSASYREHLARVLVRRALSEVGL